MTFNFFFFVLCDAPENWQVTIQDPASPALEGMLTFHEYLLFFLIQVGAVVCWFLWSNSQKPQAEKFTHESLIEIIWTFLPAIILLFIAVPSFILLYSLDDVLNPTLTVKAVGHQWYWPYEYVDSFSQAKAARYRLLKFWIQKILTLTPIIVQDPAWVKLVNSFHEDGVLNQLYHQQWVGCVSLFVILTLYFILFQFNAMYLSTDLSKYTCYFLLLTAILSCLYIVIMFINLDSSDEKLVRAVFDLQDRVLDKKIGSQGYEQVLYYIKTYHKATFALWINPFYYFHSAVIAFMLFLHLRLRFQFVWI